MVSIKTKLYKMNEKLLFAKAQEAIDTVKNVKAISTTIRGTIIPYGEKNDLPDQLLSLIYQSTTHQSVIEFKKLSVIGEGVSFEKGEEAFKALVKDLTFEEFIERTVFDQVVFGGYAWQITYNKGGKVNGIYHQPFNTIRSSALDEVTGKPTSYYIRRDWTQSVTGHPIKPYNPSTAKDDEGVQLYVKTDYSPINDFYPIPNYYSAYNYIKEEDELSRFYHNIVTNGSFPNLIVKVKSDMSDELRSEFTKQMIDTYAGGRNASKMLFSFSDKDSEGIDITPIEPVSNDNIFEHLVGIVADKIVTAHRIPRSLVAMDKNLGLSSNAEELRMSFEYFNNTVIGPMQTKIAGSINQVALEAGIKKTGATFIPLDLISQSFGEATLLAILTPDELRAKIGYEPLNTTTNDTTQPDNSGTA